MSSLISFYLKSLSRHYQISEITDNNYKAILKNLLEKLFPDYSITNKTLQTAYAAPDFIVHRKIQENTAYKYIKIFNLNSDLMFSEELKFYLPALDNLIITNYLEFYCYTKGEYKTEIKVKIAEIKDKQFIAIPQEFTQLEKLLNNFINTPIATLNHYEKLAAKMAHIARLMHKNILLTYNTETENDKLHSQLLIFNKQLSYLLKPEQFADMLAQTICYRLFIEKYSVVEQSFLRHLFNQLTGIELDERLIWMVEHLINVLNHVDIEEILKNFGKRTLQKDPVLHFYETFLAHYNPKLREVRGVYYTPEPVVSYIVRSIDKLLIENFNLKQGLADNTQLANGTHQVQILDPATGTGTFLYAVFAKIYENFTKNQGLWSDYVAQHLLPRVQGFELLIAAYTIAHIKLSLQLQEYGYDFSSNERLRIFLTNTLDEAHHHEQTLLTRWLSDEANAASLLKRESPVMVILGNPPYSGHSINTGKWISQLIRDYFQVDGKPLKERNPKWLNDDYVKFIRFAQWRIQQTGYGILGFITNHGYLANPTFRGMRQSLMQDFDEIYILDLHGNSSRGELSPEGGSDKNVFDIQQGVAIGFFIKYHQQKLTDTKIYHADLYGERSLKYEFLLENDIKTTVWTALQPQSPFYLFIPQNKDLLHEYEQGWKINECMPVHSVGIVTARDHLVVQDSVEKVLEIIQDFSQLPVETAREKYHLGADARDWKVHFAQSDLRQHILDKSKIVPILYRPFDVKFTFYTGKENGFICRPRKGVMQHVLQKENIGLITIRRSRSAQGWNQVFISKYIIAGATAISSLDINYFFPLFIYPSEKDDFIHGNNSGAQQILPRKPNFSDNFIKALEIGLDIQLITEGYGDFKNTISALDVFYYFYAILYSSAYRDCYADFLKMDFPRVPLTQNKIVFKQLSELGRELGEVHLMEATFKNHYYFPVKGTNIVDRVEYQDNKIYINKNQYFSSITPDMWEFHIGGYAVCQKWLKDKKGQVLSFEECTHYLYILAALEKTQKLMIQIDEIMSFFRLKH